MLEVFAREAGPTAARLERETPVRWQPIAYSDYHAQRPGGRPQGGRTLEPKPIDPDDRARELVRDAPNVTAPVTYVELATGEIDKEELARRAERGTLTLGRALLAALVEACLDAGVAFETGTRVRALPDADAVVLTTGGFERDPELARAFLRGPMLAPVGAPTARGDGLRMAMAAGRGARPDERGVVVPGRDDPRRLDRRRADAPADPHRARPAGLRCSSTAAASASSTRRRTTTTSAARSRTSSRPPSRSRTSRPGSSSTGATGARTASGRSRGATPTRTGSRAARRLPSSPGAIDVPPTALEATVARFNEGAARRRGSRVRPRLVPVRPLHRRPRAARGAAVLRLPRAAGLPRHEGRPAHRPPTGACSRSSTASRSAASTPPATSRRARSASPTPARAARSGRPSSSESAPARPPPVTERRG